MASQAWSLLEELLCLKTPWFTLRGERLQVPQGPKLDYWRIEKADSVIVLPIQSGQILVPPAFYRPGLGDMTVDLPGGRLPPGEPPQQTAVAILQRELGLPEEAIAHLLPLTTTGWAINSSFSNQKLHGFVVQIQPDWSIAPEFIGASYPTHPTGIQEILNAIQCAQCRLVLHEWQAHQLALVENS